MHLATRKNTQSAPAIPRLTLLLLLPGAAVGVLAGLLGIGGGVVLVPAWLYLLHSNRHGVQGTSLLILRPPVGRGALRKYWKQGKSICAREFSARWERSGVGM